MDYDTGKHRLPIGDTGIGKFGTLLFFDTFDGAKPRFLNRGKKRHSVSILSISRASDRGVEWVDFFGIHFKIAAVDFLREGTMKLEC